MIPESVYSKYSQAMFDIAQSDNSLDTVLADMKTVRTVMRENENLRKFLGITVRTFFISASTVSSELSD